MFDRERTLCECIARRKRMDREIFVKAVRNYCADPKRDIAKLSKYAKQLGIQKSINDIVGLWL